MGFFKKFFSNEERGKKEGADDEKHSKQRSPTKKPKKINRQLHRPRRAGPPRDRHRGRRHRRHLRADLAPAAARADDRDQPGRIFVFFSSLGRVLNEQKKRKLCSLSLSLHFFFFFFVLQTSLLFQVAVVARRDGVLKFMFRVADLRATQVVEPQVKAYLYTWGAGRTTADGL